MEVTRILNPRNDYAFKKLFGEERNKELTIALINAVLGPQLNKKITYIEFLETTQQPETAAAKQSVVDVLCRDQDGNKCVIEMQVFKQAGFEKRAQYYASKAYVSQMKKGGAYEDLKAVIFIAFVNYPLFNEKDGYKSEHQIFNKKTFKNELKDFSFILDLLQKSIKFQKKSP